MEAKARAGSNIALIKYWGARPGGLNLALNSSISITLDTAETITEVHFAPDLAEDVIVLDNRELHGGSRERIVAHLNRLRELAGTEWRCHVISQNSFPTAAGIASSASGFAALTVAAAGALGLNLSRQELSRLARQGSGSACRSIYGGYVEWLAGPDDESSFAEPLAPPDHWEMCDVVAVVAMGEKAISSLQGHALAHTSPLLSGRLVAVEEAAPRLRQAIMLRDFDMLGEIAEADALLMHAVMMTSQPSLLYWTPGTVEVIQAVRAWRDAGLSVYFTIDAGPNVHVLTLTRHVDQVVQQLKALPAVKQTLVCRPGPDAALL